MIFKMWDSDGVNNEGGFNTSMTSGASPTPQTEAKQNTVIHAAIRDLLNNPEENKNTHVVVVGIIKEVDAQSLKNTFTIEDNTGRLLCIQWGENNDIHRYPKLIENAYFKIVGTKRVQNDKLTLLCHCALPLTTLNELTHHLLSIIALPYQIEEINAKKSQPIVTTNRNDLPTFSDNNTNGSGYFDTSNNLSLNPKQLKVYTVIKQCQDEAGYSISDIQKILPEKMSLPEIEKIVTFFIEEGHIFSTIDEDHYKVTDFGG